MHQPGCTWMVTKTLRGIIKLQALPPGDVCHYGVQDTVLHYYLVKTLLLLSSIEARVEAQEAEYTFCVLSTSNNISVTSCSLGGSSAR